MVVVVRVEGPSVRFLMIFWTDVAIEPYRAEVTGRRVVASVF